jgi:hypothetical protein
MTQLQLSAKIYEAATSIYYLEGSLFCLYSWDLPNQSAPTLLGTIGKGIWKVEVYRDGFVMFRPMVQELIEYWKNIIIENLTKSKLKNCREIEGSSWYCL